MGQCVSSTRKQGLKNEETSRQTYILRILNFKADRKRSARSTRESGDAELSTTSTRKSGDGELSTTSTRRSVDGKLSSSTSTRKSVDAKLSATSTRKSMYGKLSTKSSRKSMGGQLATTSTPKSMEGRPSSTSTRTFGEEGPPTTSIWTYIHGKLLGMLSSRSTRKSVCLKPSPASTLKSVEGKPGSSTSTRKSADLKASPISFRKSVRGTPGSTTSTRRSDVDQKPPPTATRKSVEGRPDSTTSTRKSADRKHSTAVRRKSFGSKATKEHVAESVNGRFSADDSKFLRLRRHKEDVASTEPVQKLGWYLVQETRRDSLDHGKSRSRDSPVTPPAISSSKGDDHPRSSLRYESVERRPVEIKSTGYHGKPKTRSRDRRSKSIDTIAIDMESKERKSMEWQWIDSELSVEGKSTERRWVDRNVVEPRIDDEMDLNSKSPLDIIRGFSSTDENSNGFKAIKSRNQYFTRSGSSPARLKYLPESREIPPDDELDFLAERFLIDKHQITSEALINGRAVLAGQSDRTDTQAPREFPSAQERDGIRKSYRNSASRAASLDLNAFKSMAKTMVSTS